MMSALGSGSCSPSHRKSGLPRVDSAVAGIHARYRRSPALGVRTGASSACPLPARAAVLPAAIADADLLARPGAAAQRAATQSQVVLARRVAELTVARPGLNAPVLFDSAAPAIAVRPEPAARPAGLAQPTACRVVTVRRRAAETLAGWERQRAHRTAASGRSAQQEFASDRRAFASGPSACRVAV